MIKTNFSDPARVKLLVAPSSQEPDYHIWVEGKRISVDKGVYRELFFLQLKIEMFNLAFAISL